MKQKVTTATISSVPDDKPVTDKKEQKARDEYSREMAKTKRIVERKRDR